LEEPRSRGGAEEVFVRDEANLGLARELGAEVAGETRRDAMRCDATRRDEIDVEENEAEGLEPPPCL